MEYLSTSVDEILDDGRVRGDGRRISQSLIDDLRQRLPDAGKGGARWPEVSFENAVFEGDVVFKGVFEGRLSFNDAKFTGEARFWGAKFHQDASFLNTTFEGPAWFTEADFGRNAYFSKAAFHESALFDAAIFRKTAAFERVRFDSARTFGPLLSTHEVVLWDAVFKQRAELLIAAPVVDADGIRLESGGSFLLRWADAYLGRASFGESTRVSLAEDLPLGPWLGGHLDETPLWDVLGVCGDEDSRPRLLSLDHADSARLELGSVDLRRCPLATVRNLSELRILPSARLPTTPGIRSWSDLYRLPSWTWTRRQLIADEYLWRRATRSQAQREDPLETEAWEPSHVESQILGPRTRWHTVERRYAGTRARNHPLPAASDLAVTYRLLRGAREAASDSPGAADFYYGEAEMRRLDRSNSFGERVIWWLYWLSCGYGLRATRAILGWLVTIACFALLLWWAGFVSQTSLVRAFVFSTASTSSLFGQPPLPHPPLTDSGAVIELFLKLLGPLFFGLALISLRSRIKR